MNSMAGMLATLTEAFGDFCATEFASKERYFAIIYGSFAYGSATPQSDVDIMLVADHVDDVRMQHCIDFVKDLHTQHGLPLDTELKYEHKVLIDTDFMNEAISGAGFRAADGAYHIPPIEKTRECLESVQLRQRFLLGLMVNKHVLVSGDKKWYTEMRDAAERNLVTAITAARAVEIETPAQLKEILLRNGDDIGDFYLGFKDTPAHHAYLDALCPQMYARIAPANTADAESRSYVVNGTNDTNDVKAHDLDELIKREFVTQENMDEVLEKLTAVLESGLNFKARDKVIEHLPLDDLRRKVFQPLPQGEQRFEDTMSEFHDNILRYSTNFGSKNFMAFPDCGNSVAALAGAMMADFINQNLINSKHCAPAASMVEINVIQWLRELVGYKVKREVESIFDVGGIVVTGGVLANATAMLLAREHAFPGTKTKGICFDPSRVRVILPKYVEHYSIRASLGWLGLGEQNAIRVKTKDFKIDLDDLERILDEGKDKYRFMAIIAYAGDSRSMTIDNFTAVSKIATKHGVWFHIDACHGLQYAFSDTLRPRLGDIHLGDSITIDPHKILFLPYNLSAVLVKDPKYFREISGTSDLIMKEDYAFGQVTPFIGSKAFWSLKLWFLWKTLGRENIGRLIERRHNLAIYLSELLAEHEDFIVLNREVNINSVMFMYKPLHARPHPAALDDYVQRLNALNTQIQDKMFCKGEFYVHTFSIPDLGNVAGTGERMLQPMRFMCGNPLTQESDIRAFVKHMRELGQSLEEKYFPRETKTHACDKLDLVHCKAATIERQWRECASL